MIGQMYPVNEIVILPEKPLKCKEKASTYLGVKWAITHQQLLALGTKVLDFTYPKCGIVFLLLLNNETYMGFLFSVLYRKYNPSPLTHKFP